MIKVVHAVALVALLSVTACGVIPGTGMYASQVVGLFVGTSFTNPQEPKRNAATGSFYGNVYRGGVWLYRTEPEGSGTRYFIRFDYERCKYSLYVDENDIIRSWRDEGGQRPMNSCLVR